MSKQAEVTPFKARPKCVVVRKVCSERAGIDDEVAKRFDEVAEFTPSEPTLSPVERAMRRNAPDPAGAPQDEVIAAAERRVAHL